MTGPIPAVLLAAGGSTRMGRTKQLLPYRGRTLVWHAANELLAAGFSPTILLTGHDADAVTAAVADLPLMIHYHPDWQVGIGSTLRAAIQHVMTICKTAPAIMIALADQPGVTAVHLRALMNVVTPERIAASHYADSFGVPAVFPAAYFDALLNISDSAGAKSLLRRFSISVNSVALHDYIDIDSPADFSALSARDPNGS